MKGMKKFMKKYWVLGLSTVVFSAFIISLASIIRPHYVTAATTTYCIHVTVHVSGPTGVGKPGVPIGSGGSGGVTGSGGGYSACGLKKGSYLEHITVPAGYHAIGPTSQSASVGPSKSLSFTITRNTTPTPSPSPTPTPTPSPTPVATPGPTYTLSPTILSTVNGVSSSTAQPGDTITFNYAVANEGNGSATTTCTTYANTFNGYHAAPTPPDTTVNAATVIQNICGGGQVFNSDSTTTIGSYTVPASQVTLGTTVCTSLYVNPGSETNGLQGAATGAESCIVVANSPYFHIFGGDISAGNAQASATCDPTSNDYDASIASWNQDSGQYYGAGSQFAAYAIGKISYFATSQSNVGASAGVPPSAMAFDNTTTGSGGVYGGSFGNGTLPCMNDYYDVPANATKITSSTIDLNNLTTGAYVYTGSSTLTLSGDINSDAQVARIQLFVSNQNVYIDNNIVYKGGWQSLSDIPMFELVVNDANIYIYGQVGELDGTYVAQNSQSDGKGAGGQIATCATIGGPEPLNGSLYGNCNYQLTVSGSFVADDVLLNRTLKTLSDSSTDCPCAYDSSAAEDFIYNPSLWLIQPPVTNDTVLYSQIVDLPPTL
jgi:hypothetical protein